MYEKPGAAKRVDNVWGDEGSGDYAATARPDYIISPVARPVEAANREPVDVVEAPAQTRAPEIKNVVTDEAVMNRLLGDAQFEFTEPERAGTYYGEAGIADPTAPKPEQMRTANELYQGNRADNLGRVIPTSGSLSGPTEFGESPDNIAQAEARYQQQLRDEANPYASSPRSATGPTATPTVKRATSWTDPAPKRGPAQPTSWVDKAKKFFGG